jgi:hypothetical protein
MEAMDDSLKAFLEDSRELEDQLEVKQPRAASTKAGPRTAKPEPVRQRA